MIRILRAILGTINYQNLEPTSRHITFYSEGKSYWPHLKSLLETTLAQTNLSVCYVSSSEDDPGLAITHQRLNTFYIGMGFIRDYFFQTLQTNIMVMTMPDLHQYQIKRSQYKVHYIYVQHSLVSLHMIYRQGAFDHYDTICCAGTHHNQEIRALEKQYGLPEKELLNIGYPRLEELRAESKSIQKIPKNTQPLTILIAPSWGNKGLIESDVAIHMIDELITQGHHIILRPHPQTRKFAKKKTQEIVDKYDSLEQFQYEQCVSNADSLHQADLMISDWSGVALEFALALHKPVVFCDIPKKVNNSEYENIAIEPIEVRIRNRIGVIWDMKSPIVHVIERCLNISRDQINNTKICNLYDYSNKKTIFCEYLEKLIGQQSKACSASLQ